MQQRRTQLQTGRIQLQSRRIQLQKPVIFYTLLILSARGSSSSPFAREDFKTEPLEVLWLAISQETGYLSW